MDAKCRFATASRMHSGFIGGRSNHGVCPTSRRWKVTVRLAAAAISLVSTFWAMAPAITAAEEGLPPAVVLGSVPLFKSAELWQVLGTWDLNGDGHLDIVLGGHVYLTVLLGQEGGTFKARGPEPYAFKLVPVPQQHAFDVQPIGNFSPILAVATDLDGDLDLDLVVAVINNETELHELIAFKDGRRSVQAVKLPLPSREKGEETVHIWGLWTGRPHNGGDKVDLLLGVRALQAWEVWQLKGTGPFQWAPPVPVLEIPAGTTPKRLDDVNVDGFPDIVVVRDSNQVGVMFGQDHQPTFSEPTWLPPSLGEIFQVSLADVDRDEVPDLVVVTSKGIEIWLQRDRMFVPGPVIEEKPQGKIYLGDFNGDGLVDILFPTDFYRYAVWCGTNPASFYRHGSEYLIYDPWLVTVDLDKDGRMDLLTERGTTITAYFSHPRGESSMPMDAVSLTAVGDLSGNGAPDILVWDEEGFAVLWNDGHGGLIREEFHHGEYMPLVVRIYKEHAYILNTTGELVVLDRDGRTVSQWKLFDDPRPALCVGDFNDDGETDILTLGPHKVVVAWSGKEIKRYPWTAGELSLAWCGPAAAEGRYDVFVVSTAEFAEIYALSLDPQGLSVRGEPFQLQGIPLALDAADFDGDGQLDPVALCWMPVVEDENLQSTVMVAVGYSIQGLKEWEVLPDAPRLFGLAVADFDGDGSSDIAFTPASGMGAHILWNKGGGEFSAPVWLRAPVGPLAAADLDGNGIYELVASTVGLAPHLWILWNGGAQCEGLQCLFWQPG